jgi:hypothetical protein
MKYEVYMKNKCERCGVISTIESDTNGVDGFNCVKDAYIAIKDRGDDYVLNSIIRYIDEGE